MPEQIDPRVVRMLLGFIAAESEIVRVKKALEEKIIELDSVLHLIEKINNSISITGEEMARFTAIMEGALTEVEKTRKGELTARLMNFIPNCEKPN